LRAQQKHARLAIGEESGHRKKNGGRFNLVRHLAGVSSPAIFDQRRRPRQRL